MKWFRGGAGKKFKSKYRIRKNPKAPASPKPKYKSPAVVKRLPKVRKPSVDIPFVDAGIGMSSEAAYWTDESPMAVSSLQTLMATRGLTIAPGGISWALNPEKGTRDDDGWCESLASRTWNSFADLWATGGGKPEYYRKKDNQRSGKFSRDSIMGVAHAGCECHLIVKLKNAAGTESIYHITSTSSEPAPAAGQAEDAETVEVEVQEPAETLPEPEPELEQGPPEVGTPESSYWVADKISVVSTERVEDELGVSGEEESFW